MQVERLMTKDVKTCGVDDTANTASRILRENDCGYVPVLDERGLGVARSSFGGLRLLVLSMSVSLWFGAMANGDIVTTVDGRQFEGTIVEQSDYMVRIDAMVSGVRVKIGLPPRDIKSIEKEPVAADFYETESTAPKRLSDPNEFEANSRLYIEVPIRGRFGVQVVPGGVRRCLSYAVAHGIQDVVFFVDSQGGDQVAAKEVYDLLGRYDDRLTYHALVRDSVGVAMAVTVWCDNIFLLPGANLGGTVLVFEKDQYEGDPDVLRSQIAYETGAVAENNGWPAGIAQAMVDPAARVAAWVDSEGDVVTGVRPPTSVATDNILFVDSPQSVLTLTRKQAAAVGIAQEFSGNAARLGVELGIEAWRLESDYGQTAMFEAASANQRSMERMASRNAAEIKKLVKRRDSTRRYIERALTLANKWDPAQTTYSTYKEHERSWRRYWTGDPLEGTITASKWRQETDTTLAYLGRARKGVLEMKKLESDAERLGVEPEYPEGELDKLLDDIDVKISYLLVQRNRRTSAT